MLEVAAIRSCFLGSYYVESEKAREAWMFQAEKSKTRQDLTL